MTTLAEEHATWDWRNAFSPDSVSSTASSRSTVSFPRFKIRVEDAAQEFDAWFTTPLTDERKVQLLETIESMNQHELLPKQSPHATLHHRRFWMVKCLQRVLRKLLPRERQFMMERLSWPVLSLICDDSIFQSLLHRATLSQIIDRHEWSGWAKIVNFEILRSKEHQPHTSPTTDPIGIAIRPADSDVLIDLTGMVDGDWNFVGARCLARFKSKLARTSPLLFDFMQTLEDTAQQSQLALVFGPSVLQSLCDRRTARGVTTPVFDIYLVGVGNRKGVCCKWPAHPHVSVHTHNRSLYICDVNVAGAVIVVHLDVHDSVSELALSRKLDLCCCINLSGDDSNASIYSSLYFAVHRKLRECSDVTILSKSRDHLIVIPPDVSGGDHGQYAVSFHRKNLDSSRVNRSLNRCYHCHLRYRAYKQDQILHYAEFCTPCALFNREQRMAPLQWYPDNQDRHIALVTGGRIKIGFATCLKLLRAGARVITTTRFPMNALYRYRQECDFEQFRDRLEIYTLDLRNLVSVGSFVKFLEHHLPYLSIFINNAAQTFTYDETYFRMMYEYEGQQQQLRLGGGGGGADTTVVNAPSPDVGIILAAPPSSSFSSSEQQLQTNVWSNCVASIGDHDASCDRMTAWSFKTDRFGELITTGGEFWNERAHQVDPMRIVESNVVNLIAPSLLVSQLRGLMTRCTQPGVVRRRYIVLVTCREGTFDMRQKANTHFHTNTCKAGLNMITRTIASDLKNDNLYINSVDPGWVSSACDTNKTCPIDCDDAASRILHPIRLGEQAPREDAVINGRLWRHYQMLECW